MGVKKLVCVALSFSLLLIGSAGFLFAQTLTYSEPDKYEARSTSFEIVGSYGSKYLVYKNQKEKNYITVYNSDMSVHETVTLDFLPPRLIEASFIAYPDHSYLFYQFNQRGVVTLQAVKLGPDGKKQAEPMLIDTTVVGSNTDAKVYSVLQSEDKKQVLVFRVNTRNERRFVFKTLLFDESLTLKHMTRKAELPMGERYDFLTDFLMDNNGNLVFGRGVRNSNNANIRKFYLCVKRADADTFAAQELDFDSRYTLDEVKLKIDNYNNRYLFTGFYYSRKNEIEGIANAIFDKSQQAWVVKNAIPFSDQLREDNRGRNNVKNAFSDFFIHEVIIRNDGAFLVNAEASYETNRGGNQFNRWDYMNPWMGPMDFYRWNGWGGYGNPWMWGNPWMMGSGAGGTRYNAENIVIMAFDKNGKLLLHNQVVKSQFDDSSPNMISYYMANTGNGLQFVYNDYEARNLVLAYQTLNAEGKIIRNPTIKGLERDYKLLPRFAKQVERRVVIIPCIYRNSLCFTKLEFNA
jgi:hypothetical protein